jgi:hypothetical protein
MRDLSVLNPVDEEDIDKLQKNISDMDLLIEKLKSR